MSVVYAKFSFMDTHTHTHEQVLVFDFSNFIFAHRIYGIYVVFSCVCRVCGQLFPAERVFTIQIFVIR